MSSSNKDSFRFTIDEIEATLEHPIFMGAKLKVPTEKLAARYFNTTKKDSGLLPPVVRYTSPDFSGFIIERPPTTVRIQFTPSTSWVAKTKESIVYNLPLPWMVYVLKFVTPELKSLEAFYVYGRNEPIFSEDDRLYYIPLPNVYRTGLICQGDSNFTNLLSQYTADTDTHTIINAVINQFWQSGFNIDVAEWLTHSPEYFTNVIGEYSPSSAYGTATIEQSIKLLDHWSKLPVNEVLDVQFKEIATTLTTTGYTCLNTIKDVIGFLQNDQQMESVGGGRPLLLYLRSLALAALND